MHIRMMTQSLQAAQANHTITQAVQPVLPQQQFLQQPLQQHRPPRQLMEKPSSHQLRFHQYLKQSLRLYPQRPRQQNVWHRQQKI